MANGADRHNSSKPMLSTLLDSPMALEGLARRFEFGIKKYHRGDYKKGFPFTELIDSAMRHLIAFQNGELMDPEHPATDHLDAALWNIFILSEQVKTGTGTDDRLCSLGTPKRNNNFLVVEVTVVQGFVPSTFGLIACEVKYIDGNKHGSLDVFPSITLWLPRCDIGTAQEYLDKHTGIKRRI